jgi:tRNA(Ile)-lysidine synthetase-like protein
MLSDVLATIAARDLLHRGDRVVVAVSGGPDSMALLHVLWEVRERLGLTLEVAAVDHGLRADARREVALVRERAAALGLPFSVVEVDVAAERRARRGASIQDAARDARLRALAALARAHGANRVALGHQADDQAETILYRIVRGTGVAGLAGIPYRRDVIAWGAGELCSPRTIAVGMGRGRLGAPTLSPPITIVRPLLDVTRAQIRRYLRLRSIPSIEDPSNADTRYARARIRHHILPALAGENPRVSEALRSLAASARGEDGVAAGSSLSRRAAAAVARLAARGGTASIDVAGGRRVEVSYGKMRIDDGPGARTVGAPAGAAAPVVIERPGGYRWPGAGVIQLRDGIARGGKENTSSSAEFDADRLAWPLVMRARRPGDKMRPRGGRGGRKLSDLMIDAKIARPLRGKLPVVTTADDVVLFVPGLRPAEAGRPSATTHRRIAIHFERD